MEKEIMSCCQGDDDGTGCTCCQDMLKRNYPDFLKWVARQGYHADEYPSLSKMVQAWEAEKKGMPDDRLFVDMIDDLIFNRIQQHIASPAGSVRSDYRVEANKIKDAMKKKFVIHVRNAW
jgi:hypothetical protein